MKKTKTDRILEMKSWKFEQKLQKQSLQTEYKRWKKKILAVEDMVEKMNTSAKENVK